MMQIILKIVLKVIVNRKICLINELIWNVKNQKQWLKINV